MKLIFKKIANLIEEKNIRRLEILLNSKEFRENMDFNPNRYVKIEHIWVTDSDRMWQHREIAGQDEYKGLLHLAIDSKDLTIVKLIANIKGINLNLKTTTYNTNPHNNFLSKGYHKNIDYYCRESNYSDEVKSYTAIKYAMYTNTKSHIFLVKKAHKLGVDVNIDDVSSQAYDDILMNEECGNGLMLKIAIANRKFKIDKKIKAKKKRISKIDDELTILRRSKFCCDKKNVKRLAELKNHKKELNNEKLEVKNQIQQLENSKNSFDIRSVFFKNTRDKLTGDNNASQLIGKKRNREKVETSQEQTTTEEDLKRFSKKQKYE